MRKPQGVGHKHQTGPAAIVFDGGHPRSLATIRSLGRAGITVVSVATKTFGDQFSRYVRQRRRIENFDRDLKSLFGVLTTDPVTRGAVLFPTSDTSLIALAQRHERLQSAGFRLPFNTWQQVRTVMDRAECLKFAAQHGFRVPRHFTPQSAREMADALGRMDLDSRRYLLRSRLWTDGAVQVEADRRTRVLPRDPDQMCAMWLRMAGLVAKPPLIEEVIPGLMNDCIGVTMAVAPDHRILTGYCVRRLQLDVYAESDESWTHPYVMGGNAFCEITDDEEALTTAHRLVNLVGLIGPVTVEFKRSAEDGNLYLIKVDPRVVRATSLGTAIGCDIPLTVYESQCRLGRPVAIPTKSPDAKWMWLTPFLLGVFRARRRRRLVRELMRFWTERRNISATAYWSWQDPLPALINGVSHVRQLSPGRLRRWLRSI